MQDAALLLTHTPQMQAQQAMLWQAMLYQQQAALGDPAAAAAYAQIVNCLGIAASSSQSDGVCVCVCVVIHSSTPI